MTNAKKPVKERALSPPLHPLRAAYDVGRILAKLRFFLQQACLGRAEAWTQTEALRDSLVCLVRDLAWESEKKDDVAVTVRAILEGLLARCQSEEHGDAMVQAILVLDPRSPKYDPYADSAAIRRDLLWWTGLLTDHVWEPFLEWLDRTGRLVLGLGRYIEEGAYHPDVYRFVGRNQTPVETDTDQGDADFDPRSDATYLAGCSLGPGELDLPASWRAEVQKRWTELDFPPESMPQCLLEDTAGEKTAQVVDEIHQAAIRALEALIRERAEAAGNADEGRPEYLGLVLDHADCVARRQGVAKAVEFGGDKVGWALLRRFVRARSRYTSCEELREDWSTIGTDDKPEPGTVADAVSKLRQLLRKDLGLTVGNVRGKGWRLEELPRDPAGTS